MRPSKNETYMLNWEIVELNKKLQTFANLHSVIDRWTVDCMSQLITTIDNMMTQVSIASYLGLSKEDEQIFHGYSFSHSINCKQCGRGIKTTHPSLLKHLKECNSQKQDKAHDLIKEMLEMALSVPKKKKQENETKTSTSRAAAQQNQTKRADNKKQPNGQNVKTKPSSENVPNKKRESRRRRKTSTLSNSAVSERQTGNEPVRKVHKPNRTKDKLCITKGSIPSRKVELPKKTMMFIKTMKPHMIIADGDRRKQLSSCPAHENIIKTLTTLLQPSYPKLKAYLFGSRITGLGKETSDLDIYLDLEDNYDGHYKYSKDALKSFVCSTEQCLKLSDQWSKLHPVTAARTPILRAWNREEKIDCDISFTHGLSHSNTKLINYLFDLQPVCYYVALYAKEWSSKFNMEGLNTYTLVLLTIFYFQRHRLLPSIYMLQSECKDSKFISHWQGNFERKSLQELHISLIPETELKKHISMFFSFYGSTFCFETLLVCPFLGRHLQKIDLHPSVLEIPEMKYLQAYYDNINITTANPIYDLLSYMKPMVVQDPFELNHNVAKGISPEDVNRFRQYCALTKASLDEVSIECEAQAGLVVLND